MQHADDGIRLPPVPDERFDRRALFRQARMTDRKEGTRATPAREPQATLPDPLTPAQRQLCMSRIRGKNTKPEMVIRQGLHALGLRYRLHDRGLPGSPDLVFPARRALVFVHGCFWHGHSCPLFRLPATRTDFWRAKIGRNRERDAEALLALRAAGWRSLVIWECSLRGRARLSLDLLLGRVFGWIVDGQCDAEMTGNWSEEMMSTVGAAPGTRGTLPWLLPQAADLHQAAASER